MKEYAQILATLETVPTAILATVVDVEGSGYRRPGARMLISPDGFAIGTVSGGCLEADVLAQAKKVVASGKPTLIRYDTTKDEDSVFGLGMGCRGIVRILLEMVTSNAPIISVIRAAVSNRTETVITTTINGDRIGEHGVADDEMARRMTETGLPATVLFSGETEYFVERISPPLRLFVFGAGHDAVPLVRFADEIGWHVTVVDHRPAFAQVSRFAAPTEVICTDTREFAAQIPSGVNQAAVVMTHNFERDRVILPSLLGTGLRYVGALGPKHRTEKILASCDRNFTPDELAVLHAPVGLDIGGDTPEAIALSIVAEIQAALKSRRGGFLRERSAPIYDRRTA